MIGTPDYVIVGAGVVGLYTALFLRQFHPQSSILILERGPYSMGASTRNAGFACFGSVSELLMDSECQTTEEIVSLIKMRWEGLQLMLELLGAENLNFRQCGGYELFSELETGILNRCRTDFNQANSWASSAIGRDTVYQWVSPPVGIKGAVAAIFNPFEGSIDTGKMYRSLLDLTLRSGIKILNGINIKSIRGASTPAVQCDYFTISCQKVFITTNAFARELYESLDVRPVRNQVLVTNELNHCPIDGTFHLDKGYFYFRNVGRRILIGGGRHLLGESEETSELAETRAGIDLLESTFYRFISVKEPVRFEYQWSGIMGVSDTKQPIIQQIDKQVYAGVRMGGMGVAISSKVGKKLAALGLGLEV